MPVSRMKGRLKKTFPKAGPQTKARPRVCNNRSLLHIADAQNQSQLTVKHLVRHFQRAKDSSAHQLSAAIMLQQLENQLEKARFGMNAELTRSQNANLAGGRR